MVDELLHSWACTVFGTCFSRFLRSAIASFESKLAAQSSVRINTKIPIRMRAWPVLIVQEVLCFHIKVKVLFYLMMVRIIMADKSTIGDLKAVLENSFAEMQSDENSIKEIKKDVAIAPIKQKIEYGVVYSSEKYQEDFIVKPIKATKQTIDVPLDIEEKTS